MKRRIILSILLIFIIVFLSACGAASENDTNSDYSGGVSYNKQSSENVSNEPNNIVVIDTKGKIVYTADYSFYVENIQEVKNNITNEVMRIEGYVSSSEENENRVYITYKVPTEQLNSFLDFVDKLEGVGNKKITTNDITSAYSETQGRIETLEASKQAYEKLLRESDLSYSDIIIINKELVEINSELAKYQNIKANYDNKLDYSKVTMTIYRNSTYKEPSFFENYFEYVGDFFVGLGKGILYSLPLLIVLFVVFAAIFFPIYHKTKKKKEKMNNEESEKQT